MLKSILTAAILSTALAVPVLAHRMVLSPEAQLRGLTAGDAVTELLRTAPVPD